jgi:hypothetical protein
MVPAGSVRAAESLRIIMAELQAATVRIHPSLVVYRFRQGEGTQTGSDPFKKGE